MEVKVYATLRDVVGSSTTQVDGSSDMTVDEILNELIARYPAIRQKLLLNGKELHPAMHILVNGRDMRYLEGLETVVTAKDEIRIFPPVGGGRE